MEHENWPGFNYVSWQALTDVCTKETSQPKLVFGFVAAFIYAELGMCRVHLGVAVNPASSYGISRGYLVNNEEK